MDLGHQQLAEGVDYRPEAFGFIYEITNTVTNKKYIGKKQCTSRIKRKPLKGKTRNRIDKKESDWKSYTGSSNELNADILNYGKDKFVFNIIEWGDSKFELGYKEIKKQIEVDALLKEDYYNGIINVRLCCPKRFIIKNES